jgi:hypothetical protein
MRELRHPVSQALYGLDPENGLVKVQDGPRTGWFDWRGQWAVGDRFQIDPQMCNWVGGPGAEGDYDQSFKSI